MSINALISVIRQSNIQTQTLACQAWHVYVRKVLGAYGRHCQSSLLLVGLDSIKSSLAREVGSECCWMINGSFQARRYVGVSLQHNVLPFVAMFIEA